MDDQLQQRNQFGKLAEAYGKYRRGYPDEVYDTLRARLPSRDIDALDVGCGTGQVTLELTGFCRSVVGTDKEPETIAQANMHAPKNCRFLVAPAEALPFPDASFDLITVAQAFHWFDQPKALAEFKRVARPDSLIVILRKRGKDGTRVLADFVWPVLAKYIDLKQMPHTQSDFSKLRTVGFASCETIDLPYTEFYSPDEYLGFLKTHSSYNLIPEEQHEAYGKDMMAEIRKNAPDGRLAMSGIIEIWFLKK